MFFSCTSLISVDVSSLNLDSVKKDNMFVGCNKLTTIISSNTEAWNDSDLSIFNKCEKLTGDAGNNIYTVPSGTNLGKVDGGKDSPGLFTTAESASSKIYFSIADNTSELIWDGEARYSRVAPETTWGTWVTNIGTKMNIKIDENNNLSLGEDYEGFPILVLTENYEKVSATDIISSEHKYIIESCYW